MAQLPAERASGTEDQNPLAHSKILVVDDNVQNLELLVAYMDGLGCEVLTALDGLEALEKVKSANPDLILLDIMMPRMSGFEVCRKLKSAPARGTSRSSWSRRSTS